MAVNSAPASRSQDGRFGVARNSASERESDAVRAGRHSRCLEPLIAGARPVG